MVLALRKLIAKQAEEIAELRKTVARQQAILDAGEKSGLSSFADLIALRRDRDRLRVEAGECIQV